MKYRNQLLTILALTMATGCAYGLTAAKFPPASGPEGATILVAVAEKEYLGQLLETRPDAFLLLTSARLEMGSGGTVRIAETRILRVSYDRVERVRFESGGSGLPKWVPGGAASREQFRLISRFPQGLSPDLLQQLLKMYGQSEVAEGHP